MPRKPRIEFEGACYHVTACGNRGGEIFFDRQDSLKFLDLFGEVLAADDWTPLGWCLLPNQYHLLFRTNRATLSEGMQRLNGRYAAYVSRTHDLGGHLLQGRFKATLFDPESYLKELTRYMALLPIRAGMAPRPEQWIWGSYRAIVAETIDGVAPWLDPATAEEALGLKGPELRSFVDAGREQDKVRVELTEKQLKRCEALGSKSYLERLQAQGIKPDVIATLDQAPIEVYAQNAKRRGEAMARAHLEGGHRQTDIAAFFGVDNSTVSKAVSRYR